MLYLVKCAYVSMLMLACSSSAASDYSDVPQTDFLSDPMLRNIQAGIVMTIRNHMHLMKCCSLLLLKVVKMIDRGGGGLPNTTVGDG